jgi:hypothetical protein
VTFAGFGCALLCSVVTVVPLATNSDVSLVDPPRRSYTAREAMPPLLELRHIANHPAQYCHMRHFNAPLGHHGYEIPIAQSVGDVPTPATA